MEAVDTRVRGRYQYNVKPKDMRTARRYRNPGDLDTATLRKAAWLTTARSNVNGRTLAATAPVPRQAQRSAVEADIRDHERDQRALVLALREVEQELKREARALANSSDELVAALETPLRALWLADRCSERRARAPSVAAEDKAAAALRRESRVASKAKLLLERCMKETKAVRQEIEDALRDLEAEIQKESRGLDLNPETYSGAVLTFERPQGPPPPTVVAADVIMAESRRTRDRNSAAVEDSVSEVIAAGRAAEAGLRAAIEDAQSVQASLVRARGANRAAKAAATRQKKDLALKKQLNLGPVSGQWLTTAERFDRPAVRAHAKNTGLSVGDITRREHPAAANAVFDSALRTASRDVDDHSKLSKRLDDAILDRSTTVKVLEDVVHFRRRCKPGNPVIVKT